MLTAVGAIQIQTIDASGGIKRRYIRELIISRFSNVR